MASLTTTLFTTALLLAALVLSSARDLDAVDLKKSKTNDNPAGFGSDPGGYGVPGWGNFGGGYGYGYGYGGPGGSYSGGGVDPPSVVCSERGPCYMKKLTCPAKCFTSYSRSGKNWGGGGGGGGCSMDCKKCVAYC